MNTNAMLTLIFLPLIAGLMVLPIRKGGGVRAAITFAAVTFNLALAIVLFLKVSERPGSSFDWSVPWGVMGINFDLRLYHFSSFIILATAGFSFLVALYSFAFMKDRPSQNQYYSYLLISLAMTNGAVLADNLVVLLFFWEGLLLTLFGMIAIGRPGAWKTATKAFIIVGITDLCMMLGIILTGWLSPEHTLRMSQIHLPVEGWGIAAMALMTVGAISKAGSMPFHSWIPDAAVDAPLPFMAFLPASLEKLLGIYLLARISLDLFPLSEGSCMSYALMIIGSITILLAVAMALVQKDYKRLLSYHAISQVGYMVLGIGTALPIGIVGGLFHMINHAMYKSCLFLTGGAVEQQAGTTDLAKLGGLARKMPWTFGCFFIAAASISGVPPFNGFFSKELVYHGAWDRHWIFYAAALAGSFLTAASFLKLGHAAYFGPRPKEHDGVKEAPAIMLIPMMVIAAGCIVFGLANFIPLHGLIQPILGDRAAGLDFAGLWPHDAMQWILYAATVLVLLAAWANHQYGVKQGGCGLKAADHIHHYWLFEGVYERAANRWFDPYDLGLKLTNGVARLAWGVDRLIDWVYDGAAVGLSQGLARGLALVHTGNYSMYVLWSLIGAVLVALYFIKFAG